MSRGNRKRIFNRGCGMMIERSWHVRLRASTNGGLGTSALLSMLVCVARTCCEITGDINEAGSAAAGGKVVACPCGREMQVPVVEPVLEAEAAPFQQPCFSSPVSAAPFQQPARPRQVQL